MIDKLTLRNFKAIGEQVFEFGQFDLLVGPNNSGKSTILQALAIWQFCVDEFRRVDRRGSTGIQIVLPNFTALPLPEFILLWKDRVDRRNTATKTQAFILIEIELTWRNADGTGGAFGVQLRYQSQQTIYAIPQGGWEQFRQLAKLGTLPKIAYVPPFSGLEPVEKRLDDAPIRQQVGKGQPGGVLRNLLLRVAELKTAEWDELAKQIKRWLDVRIVKPKYDPESDVNITVDYEKNGRKYDIISGGSGFHQTLTLLAFLFGYSPTTILLDEPDAHLHVRLQREILDYFKLQSQQRGVQFLIATHAEEFARGVDGAQIISLLAGVPQRIQSTPALLRAMADVANEEITRLRASPFILYVEGETDERILRAWAEACGVTDAVGKFTFHTMGGGSKRDMKKAADDHFVALQQIIPGVKRMMLFDFDDDAKAFHPGPDNPSLAEWKRRNIENYLLVPDAWHRAVTRNLPAGDTDLFQSLRLAVVDRWFSDQLLSLPPGRTWRTVTADIFRRVDGKLILFEGDESLFQSLRAIAGMAPTREEVAAHMLPDEIHEDVHDFMRRLAVCAELTDPGV